MAEKSRWYEIPWDIVLLGVLLTWAVVAGLGLILSKYFDVPPVGLFLTVLMVALTAYFAFVLIQKYYARGLIKTDILMFVMVVGLTLVAMFVIPKQLPTIYDTARMQAMSILGLG